MVVCSVCQSKRWGYALVADDETLVRSCLAGDQKSYQLLVSRYQKKLFAVAYGMIHHTEDALDLVQETFLKGFRNLSNFQGQSSFYTWIYRVLVNLCIDFLRKEKRKVTQDYDDTMLQKAEEDGPVFALQGSSVYHNPLQAVSNKELGQHIWNAIEDLSENHKLVILLREVEGLSYEEIADSLQCSKGTVMSRLHHARCRLRHALEKYVEPEKPTSPHAENVQPASEDEKANDSNAY